MPSNSGYLRHFVACNKHDLSHFVPFFIDGKRLGRIKTELAASLPHDTGLFVAQNDGIALAPRFTDFKTRSAALMEASELISARTGKPLRKEMYAVIENWGDEPLAEVDRAAVPWFGTRAWGIHVNGFVRKKDGIHLWVGERAADRPADPGKLDNMIGGGQPIGLTLDQNLCKEAFEEAGIAPSLALTAKLAREINYLLERPDGLRTDTLFIYDMDLPESFVPRNTDGEVASFRLLPLNEVAALIFETDRFKFNCNMVITDFLLRQGFLTPKDAEYEGLARWLKE